VDEITPPSTVFAVYNHLKCPKEISVFRYFGHEHMPGSVEIKLRILMDELNPYFQSGDAKLNNFKMDSCKLIKII